MPSQMMRMYIKTLKPSVRQTHKFHKQKDIELLKFFLNGGRKDIGENRVLEMQPGRRKHVVSRIKELEDEIHYIDTLS